MLLVVAVSGCALPAAPADFGDVGGGDPDLSRPVMNGLKDLAGLDLRVPGGGDLGSADLKMGGSVDLAGADLSSGGVTNAADLCANAPTLVAGVTYVDHDTTPFNDDYDFGNMPSAACLPAFDGFGYDARDGAYRFTIDPGKTLSVVLTKNNIPYNWDAAMAIVTNCASPGPSCLSGSDAIVGNTEQVSYKNTGATALPVFIIVDGFIPTEYGKYSIRADVN